LNRTGGTLDKKRLYLGKGTHRIQLDARNTPQVARKTTRSGQIVP
jgi:hypothetical protein